ncbi:MAG TPA: hypothetical protein VIM46_01415, partial [Luteolibacter sp.]
QVKTTEWAKRYSGKKNAEKKLTQLQWYLGRKAAKANLTGLFIVFVDYDKWSAQPKTDCYVVPSAFVYEFCKSWIDRVSMVRLHISPDLMMPYRDAWHLIEEALKKEPNQAPEPTATAVTSAACAAAAPAASVAHL